MAAPAVAALAAVDSSQCLSFVPGFLPFLSTSCRAVQRTKVPASSYKQLESLYSTLFMGSANGCSPQLLMTGKGHQPPLQIFARLNREGAAITASTKYSTDHKTEKSKQLQDMSERYLHHCLLPSEQPNDKTNLGGH